MTGQVNKNMSRKYVPHLGSMLQVCEHNYARLLRLLPDCDTENLEYQCDINQVLNYKIKIVECSRYTSTLEMSQKTSEGHDYLNPMVQIRLYHDAKLAEVLTAQNIGSLQPSYQYPNIKMHQKNEKEMVNIFLAEWLQFCLKHSDQFYSSKA